MGDLSLGMYWNIQILFGTWKVARMFGKLQICAKVKFTQRSLKIPLKTKWGDGKTFAPSNRFAMMP